MKWFFKRLWKWAKGYFYHVLIAIDQLLNALLGGNADETLSSRTYRRGRANLRQWQEDLPFKWRWLVAWLVIDVLFIVFFWQTRHCEKSFDAELKRKHWGD